MFADIKTLEALAFVGCGLGEGFAAEKERLEGFCDAFAGAFAFAFAGDGSGFGSGVGSRVGSGEADWPGLLT